MNSSAISHSEFEGPFSSLTDYFHTHNAHGGGHARPRMK